MDYRDFREISWTPAHHWWCLFSREKLVLNSKWLSCVFLERSLSVQHQGAICTWQESDFPLCATSLLPWAAKSQKVFPLKASPSSPFPSPSSPRISCKWIYFIHAVLFTHSLLMCFSFLPTPFLRMTSGASAPGPEVFHTRPQAPELPAAPAMQPGPWHSCVYLCLHSFTQSQASPPSSAPAVISSSWGSPCPGV